MTGILAIETATDACSVAIYIDGKITERHELAPRRHSQLLFGILEEMLPGGQLTAHGIEAIAYGSGPGSFTGLRIAASAVQGLAYSSNLPAVAVSTLAVMAQGALRCRLLQPSDTVLCTVDARINEIYSAVYSFEDGLAVLREGPWACAPVELDVQQWPSLKAVGSGCLFIDEFPPSLQAAIGGITPDLLPAARDLIPLALRKLSLGETQSAQAVQPLYVRDEIHWKKLAEQGKKV